MRLLNTIQVILEDDHALISLILQKSSETDFREYLHEQIGHNHHSAFYHGEALIIIYFLTDLSLAKSIEGQVKRGEFPYLTVISSTNDDAKAEPEMVSLGLELPINVSKPAREPCICGSTAPLIEYPPGTWPQCPDCGAI